MTTDEKGVFIQIQNTIVSSKVLGLVKFVSTLLSMIVGQRKQNKLDAGINLPK